VRGHLQRFRSVDRGLASRAAVALGIFVLVVGYIGLSGPTTGPTATSRPSSGPTAAAHATIAPTLGPAQATPQPWEDLVVPPYAKTAELVPSDVDRAGVATAASFTLRSLTATPAVNLAAGLRIEPSLSLAIKPGSTADTAIIRPAHALTPGTRYRFTLTGIDGSLSGSWAFIARAPLHVTTTLPGDRAIRVPLNTGIEITFDQDGPTGVADHVSIKPAVEGRFETHGRTVAFVPTRPLAPATIYTVTVRAGIGLDGSTETLEDDIAFQFETASGTSTASRFDFARPITEVRPKVSPVILLRVEDYDEHTATSAKVDVARLPDMAAAIDAARRLAGAAAWAVASPDAVVDVTGLEHVTTVDATITDSETGRIMVIPARLATGRYILTVAQDTGPAQLLLLVTNLAVYTLVGTETTVMWAHDLATVKPVRASVSFDNGTALGQTNAEGVLRVATPARLKSNVVSDDSETPSSPAQILTVRDESGRSTLILLGLPTVWGYEGDCCYNPAVTRDRWWLLFQTDRTAYLPTDTIHLWGLVRARSDRSVPTDVQVRLRPDSGSDDAPILRVTPTLTARGTFITDLRLVDLPHGSYAVDLVVRGSTIASEWIYVTEIRKPAYRIEVQTDHDVYVAGTPSTITATATFYDGTGVPGLELAFAGYGQQANATTNADGVASVTLRAGWEYQPQEDWASHQYVTVSPRHPEEGEISGDADAIVLPARVWLEASGTVASGRVVADAHLTSIDLAAYEAAVRAYAEPDVPPGQPVAGKQVRATVTRLAVTRTQVGTTYDFVTKTVVPQFEESVRRIAVGTYTLTTSADGTAHLSVAVPEPGDVYEVAFKATDAKDRAFTRVINVAAPSTEPEWWMRASLEATDSERDDTDYAVGDTVSMTLHEPDGSIAEGGRFLFIVARDGRLDPTVQAVGTFTRTFGDADLPGFTLRAVWVTAAGFTVADRDARVDRASKTLKISLAADQARYRPGDEAQVTVRVTSPGGTPAIADVIVQALDEKLYTLGLAGDPDPTWTLLQLTAPGFVLSYASHATPFGFGGGMGDGGGGRDDFRDVATFQRVTTDANGRATVRFTLPDDLTGWHVTATAISGKLDAGVASIVLPTGLPFFADALLAPEYLVGEEPVLQVRGYGDALAAGDTVAFTVTSPDLGVNASVSAAAFATTSVQLPALSAGTHRITISAQATHGATVMKDALVRTIKVIPTRLEALATRISPLDGDFAPTGGGGLTTYVITDTGRGSVIALLQDLASSSGPRFDQAAAADVARSMLISEFGFDEAGLPPSGYESDQFQRYGIALLPYADGDLVLTAKAALTVAQAVSQTTLYERLAESLDEPTTTREQRIQALAGLAGIGENVLAELRAFDWRTLTVREQLWIALGLAASGDEDGARTIERALLEAQGQRLGPWVRLEAGPGLEGSRQATALLLVLASRIGDPLAVDMARYLRDQPSTESLVSLELLAYADAALDRLPRAAGRFAFTIDGKRTEVALERGASYRLVLTSEQRAGFSLVRLEGSLEVVTSWEATDVPLPADPSLTVKRTVSPAGSTTRDGLVTVTIEVTFGAKAPAGCYRLTDLVPSGLAPIISTGQYSDGSDWVIGPYEVEGQRVSWCVSPKDTQRFYGYRARVVSPGTYRWEPAVLQSAVAPSLGASTPATTYRIN